LLINGFCLGESFIQIFPHSFFLATLARKQKCLHLNPECVKSGAKVQIKNDIPIINNEKSDAFYKKTPSLVSFRRTGLGNLGRKIYLINL
jgi:hypothetical protein